MTLPYRPAPTTDQATPPYCPGQGASTPKGQIKLQTRSPNPRGISQRAKQPGTTINWKDGQMKCRGKKEGGKRKDDAQEKAGQVKKQMKAKEKDIKKKVSK